MARRIYKRKTKNSPSWTASVSVKGVTPPKKPYTKGGFKTREQAEEHAIDKEREFLNMLDGIPKLKRISFRAFAEIYLKRCKNQNTLKYYRCKKSVIEKAMVPFFEDRNLIGIRPADIEAYIAMRMENGRSKKTISNEFGIFSHMLNYAVKRDYLRENVCNKVDRPKFAQPRPEVLSLDQIKQVFKFTEENEEFQHCIYMVKFLFYTGCRRGEICNLRWCDVDLEQDIITVHAHDFWHPKDYEARTIGICQTLHKTLVEFIDWQKAFNVYGKYLFPREIYGFEDYVTTTMRKLMNAAEVPVKQPVHVWRHSFAYHMIRGGTRPAFLQELMGHQDIRTTIAYFKLTKDDVAAQTEVLPDF